MQAAAAGGEGSAPEAAAGAARVDFFGHAVNAAELAGVARQMRLLDSKLAGLKVGAWVMVVWVYGY